MDSWVPLFDIFINSATPETDAARWLHESFDASSSTRITAGAFLSLLTEPQNVFVFESSPSSPSSKSSRIKRVMFMETLPSMVQSRILSFLAFERQSFSAHDLSKLARNILTGGEEIDFWVERSARHLFDVLPDTKATRPSSLSFGNKEGDEFDSVPDWLMSAAKSKPVVFPWLPISLSETTSVGFCDSYSHKDDDGAEDSPSQARENGVQGMCDDVEDLEIEVDAAQNASLEHEARDMAIDLKARLLNFESTAKTVSLASEIRELCLRREVDSIVALDVIEPWKVDDDTASILVSHLTDGTKDELSWPSQVLCSLVLPKLLLLEVPVARVLLSATVEFCKLHQRAAVHGLLFPLMLRKEGINNPICDVITRIIRECLHSAHVTAFCQKLLCGGNHEKRYICMPSQQSLISDELVWTESLFSLLHNILSHNVRLTQDTVDQVVSQVLVLSERFSRSLKFGNFLLCLVTKCSSSVISHKLPLTKAVECTDTLVTKSILSRLSSL